MCYSSSIPFQVAKWNDRTIVDNVFGGRKNFIQVSYNVDKPKVRENDSSPDGQLRVKRNFIARTLWTKLKGCFPCAVYMKFNFISSFTFRLNSRA